MWILLGALSILSAIINIVLWLKGKKSEPFRFLSISFTALTLCAFYSMNSRWVALEDWSALMDVVPTMSKALWGLVIASITINAISIFKWK